MDEKPIVIDDKVKDVPLRARPILKEKVEETAKTEGTVDESQEDTDYKLVITVEERYDTLEKATAAYQRFVGGHGINRVVMMCKGKTLEQGAWGSVIDEKGYHTIDGTQATIKFLAEHM